MEAKKKITNARVTFVNDPLRVISILFNHTMPLDLSITKYCFQGCPFCFANANRKVKENVIGSNLDPTNSFIKRIQKANSQGYNPEDIHEYCLHNKMPIVFSNNVDPFMPASEHQFKIGERILETCLEFKQPLFIQTKEVYYGDKIRDLLLEGKDIFQLYVSLSTLDYDIAKKYETVQVTPQERLDKVKELSSQGMQVIAALNPYQPDWVPDLDHYFKTVKEYGFTGVFAFPLHFTPKQAKVAGESLGEYRDLKCNLYDNFDADCVLMEEYAKKHDLGMWYTQKLHDKSYAKGITINNLNKWPIDAFNFIYYVKSIYDEYDDYPILVSWSDIDTFFSKYDIWEHIFKLDKFTSALATTNEKNKFFRSALGKRNRMKNIIRLIYNYPDMFEGFLIFFENIYPVVEIGEDSELELAYDDNDDLVYMYDENYDVTERYWHLNSEKNKDREFMNLDLEPQEIPTSNSSMVLESNL